LKAARLSPRPREVKVRIVHYFSPMSGYAYLGFCELVRLAARHGVAIDHRPVDIARLFNAVDTTAPAKQSPARLGWRQLDMTRWARRRGLMLNVAPKFWPVDASLASRCIVAAQMTGQPVAGLIASTLSAVWARNEDIASERVLSVIAASNGFDPQILLQAAASAEVTAAYESNTQTAIDAGVIGSPTICVGSAMFFGQDRLDFVEEELTARKAA
jgi:carboxymethylenebutenolidase